MSSNTSILVLGAGELGTAVLTALALHPHHPSLTVLLRPSTITFSSPIKKTEISKLKSLGITTLPCDIVTSSIPSLTSTFTPFHTIISCTGMSSPAGTQLKILHAILAARTPRYFPWQFGVDYDLIGRNSSQDLFSEQLDVRDLLRAQSTTKWVILSTGLFMNFLFWPDFGVVGEKLSKVCALGSWESRITVTTAGDIGRVVAALACETTDVQGVVYTAGQTLTFAELADVVERVTGKQIQRELKPVSQLQQELSLDPENGIKRYRVVFAEGKGVAWDEAGTWEKGRGMEMQGVEGWMRENQSRQGEEG